MAGILAVDDDLSILKLIKNALETEGHQVTVCSDSAHVLTMDLNRYQLILLDVMMPGIDGFELCSEIRHRVDCPILFLTAKTREADIVRGLGYGADDYLTKPFGIAELRARVDAHLRRDQREKRHSVVVGGMRLSLRSKECFVGPLKAPLTRSEYDILTFAADLIINAAETLCSEGFGGILLLQKVVVKSGFFRSSQKFFNIS
jgi:DNA-binding response OmpR family regulator